MDELVLTLADGDMHTVAPGDHLLVRVSPDRGLNRQQAQELESLIIEKLDLPGVKVAVLTADAVHILREDPNA